VAQRAKLRFVELDPQIEQAAGMPLADLFTLHGESHYRQLERDVLLRLTRDKGARPLLLATGGGIVAAPETFELLRRHFVTIWLKATPEDHWSRVVEQGDARPMQGQPAAMARMRQILADRAPLYRLAHHVVDTSALGLAESTARVRGLIEGRVAPPAPAAP
jgi:XRE family aerobic/anaerobic benzoate catabolism transcriptional regulator